MTYTITSVNLKGGVAKTTTTIQLAHELARQGYDVLVIDGDPDICLTEALDMEQEDDTRTIYRVLADPASGIAGVVRAYNGTAEQPLNYSGRFNVIPGSRNISRVAGVFANSVSRQPVASFDVVLWHIIKTYCQGFDFVLIDPSPSRDPLTDALLYAADGAIVPVSVEAMPKRGVLNMMRNLRESNASRATYRIPGEIRLLGLLISKVIGDQRAEADGFLSTLDQKRIPHFRSVIPYTTAGWKSAEFCLPIAEFAPDDAAAQAFRMFAEEVKEALRVAA